MAQNSRLYSTATRKTITLGRRCESLASGIPTCWYLKTLKFALPPTQTPNANRWNIGRVRSPTQNSRVGHVGHSGVGQLDFVHVAL